MTETVPHWHKSSYSGNTNDACVEVAVNLATIRIRDTKDHAKGELTAARGAWSEFTAFAGARGV
ncbi:MULTISPECIES: DUF397 domain-containing protein [unclassified Streptomyces]|uniref:DUF397 domain-containing protein n=1 Tax=unclassified Streptomyces TaxID=2593676 RepID=UPI0016608F2E|nr:MULTISPECIES: DUF397 domain-containing protein [unclassified Streptomyces]MBD0712335.1 DUF397 domain-containing protein [Streptomyces sp. CBMA291]MBD0716709.1 DUF397 domain-containing protein [Streptomyces sp. CBMA370]